MNLFTLGYEGLKLERFIEILNENQVDTLVDVRDYPYSRKPGFSQAALNLAVQSNGIRYIHVKALGAPKPIRDAYKQDGDWTRYSIDYKRHLRSLPSDLNGVMRLAIEKTCCLMCFEADANRCHRSYVAAELAKLSNRALRITHLTGQDQVQIDTLQMVFA